MTRFIAAIVALAGCGRFGFEGEPDPTGDGATGDGPGGSIDADPTDVGAADCVGYAGALFCDGFEDPALARWQLSGMVSRMATTAIRGYAALQAETQTTQEISQALVDLTPITSGTLAVRGWFFVPSGYVLDHFDLLDIKALGAGGGLAILAYQDELALYQSVMPPGGVAMQATPFPTDRWLCIELQIQVGDPGSATLLLDGVQVASFTGIDLSPANGYSRLSVGIPWTDGAQTPARAYTDEIVIDTKPIGCT